MSVRSIFRDGYHLKKEKGVQDMSRDVRHVNKVEYSGIAEIEDLVIIRQFPHFIFLSTSACIEHVS
jgi:hypothetical protein